MMSQKRIDFIAKQALVIAKGEAVDAIGVLDSTLPYVGFSTVSLADYDAIVDSINRQSDPNYDLGVADALRDIAEYERNAR